MVGQNTYVPPRYIPLEQSDAEADGVPPAHVDPRPQHIKNVQGQWSSGICACFDDMQSCVMLGAPGCFVACYACGYRRTLRENYNLEEAPCGDFVTHFFCHLCAMCQEYREIRERSRDPNSTSRNMVEVAAPPVQIMDSASAK